jgi:spore coat protein JB
VEGNMNKEKLLREIQVHKFAVIEANLFLDTHPDNQEALQFYKKHAEKLHELQMEWERSYGPVMELPSGELRWAWVDNPWPWHIEEA